MDKPHIIPTGEEAKGFGKYFITGVLIMLSIGGLGALGTGLGLKSINVASFSTFGHAIITVNLAQIAEICFAFIAISGIILFWVRASHVIGRILHEKKEMESPLTSEVKTKIRFVPMLLFGMFLSIIIYAILNFAYQITGVEMTNVNQVYDTFTTFTYGNIAVVIGVIISMAVIGWFMIHMRNTYPTFFSYTPKKLEKIEDTIEDKLPKK